MHSRLFATVCVLLMSFCVSAQAGETLRVAGSSTIFPILSALAKPYADQTGNDVDLVAGGSGAGIRRAADGSADVGMVSRSLSDEESARLAHTTIGLDTLVFIVNSANPLTAITRAQLVDIYSGQVRDWQALSGFDRPVVLVSKEVGRSTLELFEEFTGMASPDRKNVGNRPVISDRAYVIGANLEAVTLVGGMEGAIGYVSLGTAVKLRDEGMPIRILDLEGVTPSPETVVQRRYPILRELNVVYRDTTPPIEAMLTLLLGSEGQRVVNAQGFLTVR